MPTPMAVDQRSGLEMGRDRGTAAAANAAAADAAAAALVAAAAATKVAADAGDMTQFLAATKAVVLTRSVVHRSLCARTAREPASRDPLPV